MIPFQLHRRIPFVRRPFFQRDQALAERDAALVKHDQLAHALGNETAARDEAVQHVRELETRLLGLMSERDHLRNLHVETANLQLPDVSFALAPSPQQIDDGPLVARLIGAYRAATETVGGPSGSFWDHTYFDFKRDVHDALLAGHVETVQALLRNPAKTDLFYGFDGLVQRGPASADFWQAQSIANYHDLLKLAAALGTRRLWWPEAPERTVALPGVDALLSDLDNAMGLRIDIPNPFPDEVGLDSSRGVVSYRAIQALYQAWRIFSLVKGDRDASIVEIGAGLGRTAFYAAKLGLGNFTIIDLPLTNVAQGYFLGRTLGADQVSLFGESCGGIVHIAPPAAFLDGTDSFDLVVNVDSMTEMDRESATDYCRAIKNRAGKLLSINHEANAFTVQDLCREHGMPEATRTPYWMRQGYVDEVYVLR